MKKLIHLEITYVQLLLYGVHIGHSFKNSILYTSWLVYTYSQNILIINLFKSLYSMRSGFIGLNMACHYRNPVWFINLDTSFSSFIQHSAQLCGEISWTNKWVNGLISNYRNLYKVFFRLSTYSSNAYKKSQYWVNNNVHQSQNPTREAYTLKIPCFGITDTNTLCNFINLPVPGNDDSIDCIIFYTTWCLIIYFWLNFGY